MAVKKELTIEIAPDGMTEISGHGFKGAECDDSLKPFEKIGAVKRRRHNEEFHKAVNSQKTDVKTG